MVELNLMCFLQRIFQIIFLGGNQMKKNVPYFTLKGRLNRKRFLKRYLITVVCIFLLVLIITIFDTSLDFSPRGMKPIVEKARIE